MRVLSIDPGLTTGIAMYDEEQELEISFIVPIRKISSKNFLGDLVRMTQPDMVLVEDVPKHKPNLEIVELKSYITRWFEVAGYRLQTIQPSAWKGLAKRVEIPSQHARDAATMARWWIESKRNEQR